MAAGRLCRISCWATTARPSPTQQPLILDDGTVYGVLGVELLESYMDTKLPWDELQNDHHGSYLLASTTSDLRGEVLALHVTSNTGEQSVPLRNAKWELTLQRSNNCWYYICLLYTSPSPRD